VYSSGGWCQIAAAAGELARGAKRRTESGELAARATRGVPLARIIGGYGKVLGGLLGHSELDVLGLSLVSGLAGSNCQGEGRGFESRRPLQRSTYGFRS
jgi:hypothetical protein